MLEMCGIFGYVGSQGNGIEIILNGLHGLEHRGYDSMGAAFLLNHEVEVYKKSKEHTGEISPQDIADLIKNKECPCYLGIGHTRWASCGVVNDVNAHPHWDEQGEFFIVHNGNVENYNELKRKLSEEGRKIISQTDTELIAHLIAYFYQGDLMTSVELALSQIEGAHAILVMSKKHPDILVAANRGGALLIGKTEQGIIVTSEPLAFPNQVTHNIVLDDNELAIINKDSWQVVCEEKVVEKEEFIFKNREEDILEEGFDHYMQKEIFEQPAVLANTIRGRYVVNKGIAKLGGIGKIARDLRQVKTFHFIGCGTAYYACCYAVLLFNRFGISAKAWIASEFSYCHPVFHPNDAFVFVSQSGETADTIATIDEVKLKGNICLGVVNVAGSKIARLTDAGIYIRVGKEKGVASTKAFTGQMMVIVLLAVFLARQRKMTADTAQRILVELELIPEKIDKVLEQTDLIKQLAEKYKGFTNYYFLGRYFSSVVAQEGALKLKEISYVHAESCPLGEVKHGPLALVDENFCNMVIIPRDSLYKKSLVNIFELKARLGKVIAITTADDDDLKETVDDVIYLPQTLEYLTPLLTTIPLQLYAYYMAVLLGFNPDKPRNLAKTVTVG